MATIRNYDHDFTADEQLKDDERAGGMIDIPRIKAAVLEILEAIGDDPNREGLADTPRRIAEMYAEIFSGLHIDPISVLNTSFSEDHHEMVVLKDIPFYSTCEHHFAPFHGRVHVGYIPNGKVVGVSKLARCVEAVARRPQLQERITYMVAESLMKGLSPMGAGVVVEAEHLCMTMRGIKKPGSKMITSAMRGVFEQNAITRNEFLSLVMTRGDIF